MILRIIELNYDKIKTSPMLNPIEYAPLIAKVMTGAEFKNAIKIAIDEATIQKIEDENKKDFSKKWASEQTSFYTTMRHIQTLTKNEIKLIEEEYSKFIINEKKSKGGASPTRRGPEGVSVEQFTSIIKPITSKDPAINKALDNLDHQALFNIFDLNKTGRVEFK